MNPPPFLRLVEPAEPPTPQPPQPEPPESLHLDLDGFEGPLDLLLILARRQKVDLRALSVLTLARQYLDFVEEARSLRIELAADWLVMAAWLAFLKSKLLLPEPEIEGPSADELAARLAFRLARLDAMRDAAAALMARPRLGRERFARGAPEAVAVTRETSWAAGLMELMAAYARVRTRDEFRPFAFERPDICTMEQALDRMRQMLGPMPGWTELAAYLPEGWRDDPTRRRSATAATFAASLELARQGVVELQQAHPFAPLLVRRQET